MRYIPEFQWFLIVEQGESGVIGSLYRTFLMNVAVCGLATALIAVIILGILKFYDRK
jgi:hypothetical protein